MIVRNSVHYEYYRNGQMVKAFATHEQAVAYVQRKIQQCPGDRHELAQCNLSRNVIVCSMPAAPLEGL